MNITRFFAALYLSSDWNNYYERTGNVAARARAVVLFDRVITERTPLEGTAP